MAKIKLPCGRVALLDHQDFKRLAQLRWCSRGKKLSPYVRHWDGNKWIAMHNLIMNPPPGFQVDHINRNGLDNRRSNLRLATPSENMCNRGPSSGRRYKGVYWRGDKRAWVSRITVNRQLHYIGFFKSPEKAALAYDEAAKRFHGEFAYLNFPRLKLDQEKRI